MNNFKALLRCSALTALSLAWPAASWGQVAAPAPAPTPASSPPASASPADQATAGVDDIIVTAQRREESLQRVPLAITAISSAALREQNVQTLADVARIAPNIAISSSGYTAPTNALPVIYIRGIGQQDPSIYSDPGVPVYVDGIYVARSAGGAIDLPDIGRVEVLRGPQGTLFGKNAVGGAVNIATAVPGVNPGTRVDISGGSYDLFEVRGVTNLRLSDTFGLTAAIDARREDGFGNRLDVATGNRLGRLGDQRHLSGRLRARWTPTEALTIDLSGDYTRYRDTATPAQATIVASGLLTLENARVATPRGLTITQATAASGDYDNFSRNPQRVSDNLGGVSATIAYEVGGGATLKSITAYREATDSFARDVDTAAIAYFEAYRNMHSSQFTQELQLVGKVLDGKLDYILGGFYLHDSSTQFDGVLLTPDLYAATGNNVAQDRARNYDDSQTTNSYAGYAQVTLHLADRLGLTAGLRYTDEQKRASVFVVSPVSNIVYVPRQSLAGRWTALTPRFAIDFRASDHFLAYASASRGFKSGGFNGRPSNQVSLTTFDPEQVWSYEAGIKSEFLDRRVRLNLAGFIADYSNIQLSRQTIDIPTGVLISDISNVAASRIKGFEGELVVAPVRGLELSAAAGYTDNTYTRVQAGAVVTPTNKIPYAPDWTVNLSARYRARVGSGTLTPSVNYAYRAATYTTPNNSPFSLLPSYDLVSARLAYAPADSFWELSIFGTNLADKRYRISIGDSNGVGLVYNVYGRPRELGVTLGLRF